MTPLTELRANHIRGLFRDARARRGDSEFAIEGPHLLEAALEKAPKLIEYVAFTQDAVVRYTALLDRAESLGIEVHSLPTKLSYRISDTPQPQGIFAVTRMPRLTQSIHGNAIIVLDGVQDPGNVGTIIRSAAWFGVPNLLIGEGTADPYAPKVVRGTQGAIFDVNIDIAMDLVKRLTELKNAGWQILAATLAENAQSIFEVAFPEKVILLLGAEARGIRPELLELATEQIVIPKYGAGESLNVAISGAIILAEFRRRKP
jgi:RNA methyltransferase, TrmH family